MVRLSNWKKILLVYALIWGISSGCGEESTRKIDKNRKLDPVTKKIEAPPVKKADERLQLIPPYQLEAWSFLGKGKSQTTGGTLIVDSDHAGIQGSCITGDKPSEFILEATEEADVKPDGQTVEVSFEDINTKNQLRKSLKVGLQANGFYNGIDFSSAMSLSDNFERNEHTRSLLLRVVVKNSEIKMRNFRLKDNALALLKRDKNAFYKRCGKEAIIGYKTGGEANALVKISSEEKVRESDISAILELNGVGAGIESDFSKQVVRNFSKYSTQITQKMRGGNSIEISNTLKGIIKLYEKWPSFVAKNPVVYEYITIPYSMFEEELIIGNEGIISDRLNYYGNQYDRFSDLVDFSSEILQESLLPSNDLSEALLTKATKKSLREAADKIRNKIVTNVKRAKFPNEKKLLGDTLSSFDQSLENLRSKRIDFEKLTGLSRKEKFRSILVKNKLEAKKLLKSLYYAISACEKAHLSRKFELICIEGNLELMEIDQLPVSAGGLSANIEADIDAFGLQRVRFKKEIHQLDISWLQPVWVNYTVTDYSCPGSVRADVYRVRKTGVCGAGRPSEIRCKKGYTLTDVQSKYAGKCWGEGGPMNERNWYGLCVRKKVLNSCSRKKVALERETETISFQYEQLVLSNVDN